MSTIQEPKGGIIVNLREVVWTHETKIESRYFVQ